MNAPPRCWSATHPGSTRKANRDAYLCRPDLGLFVVADGVGMQAGGGMAAVAVMRELDAIQPGQPPLTLLRDVCTRLETAHHRLITNAATSGNVITATTVVVLLLHGSHLACLWAGDSRAYLLRQGMLMRLTTDHSLVAEMHQAAELTQAQAEAHPAANVITRAIGVESDGPLLDRAIGDVEPGDRFLLCSDGLSKAVPEVALVTALLAPDPAQALIAAALARKATDNVTAVVTDP